MSGSDEPAEVGPSAGRRRRRRWALGLSIACTVVLAGGVVAFTMLSSTATPTFAPTTPAPATAQVARMTLTDQLKIDGDLGNGQAIQVSGRKAGTITRLPAVGTVVNRGESLYEVDAVPVPLLIGATPLYRELAERVPDGADVKLLQENLHALGYTDFGAPDGEFGAGTTKALKRWQKDRKVEQTGKLAPGDAIVSPGPIRVNSTIALLGASAEGPVCTVTGTERLVTIELTETQKRSVKAGGKATVKLADGRSTAATVRELGTKTDSDGKSSKPIAVVGLDDAALAASLEQGRVTVLFDGVQRPDVLTVPVQALLALRGGGYGVEVVEGVNRRVIPVQSGLFANGLVEVSGDGLVEGMTVVTAS